MATENTALNSQIREDTTPDTINKLVFIEISPYMYRGYDKKILAQNLHSTEEFFLTCKFCKGIMKDAVSDKGENMCSSCSNSKSFGLYPATYIRNTVNKLQCKCPLRDRGCKWLGTVSKVYDHIKNVCPKLLIRCSLKCEAVLRKELLEHHKLCICPNRIVQCEDCKDHLEYTQMNEHLSKCVYCSINCNFECGTKIRRKELAAHINKNCPMAILDCPYAKWGCAIKDIKRKDMKEHMKSYSFEHANISYKLLTKLQISLTEGLKENKQQKQVSEELQTMLTECSKDIIQQKQVSKELQVKFDNSSNQNMQQKAKLVEYSKDIIKQKQVSEGLQLKLANSSKENMQQKAKIAVFSRDIIEQVSDRLQTQFEQCLAINLQYRNALQNDIYNLRDELVRGTFGFVTYRSLLIYVCPVLLILLVYYIYIHY